MPRAACPFLDEAAQPRSLETLVEILILALRLGIVRILGA